MAERLSARKIRLELNDDAVAFLGERGYDPAFGARPVKRVVQQLLETAIAKVLPPPHLHRILPSWSIL